jgi:hypothetical protein
MPVDPRKGKIPLARGRVATRCTSDTTAEVCSAPTIQRRCGRWCLANAQCFDWEPLSAALRRVRATDASDGDAKAQLYQAMAAGTVAVRFAPLYTRSAGTRGLSVIPNMFVSPHLKPDDLDWVNSRPLTKSSIGPISGLSGAWAAHDPVALELWIDDGALCGVTNEAFNQKEETHTELEAIHALAAVLQETPNLKREEARWWCEGNFELSGRGFQYRVWPRAREQAGLSSKAAPGCKSKSPH